MTSLFFVIPDDKQLKFSDFYYFKSMNDLPWNIVEFNYKKDDVEIHLGQIITTASFNDYVDWSEFRPSDDKFLKNCYKLWKYYGILWFDDGIFDNNEREAAANEDNYKDIVILRCLQSMSSYLTDDELNEMIMFYNR